MREGEKCRRTGCHTCSSWQAEQGRVVLRGLGRHLCVPLCLRDQGLDPGSVHQDGGGGQDRRGQPTLGSDHLHRFNRHCDNFTILTYIDHTAQGVSVTLPGCQTLSADSTPRPV